MHPQAVPTRVNRLLLLGLIAPLAACATVLGFEEPTDLVVASDAGATASPTRTQDTTKPETPSAPITQVTAEDCMCVPNAPTGWNGPYVVAEGTSDEANACLGLYPHQAFAGYEGWTARPARCECACGAPTGAACSTPVVSLFAESTCAAPGCHVETAPLDCAGPFACDDAKKITSVSFGPSIPSGGKCEGSSATTLPAPSWAKSIRLCAPEDTAAMCENGVCQRPPSPLFAAKNRCVFKSGELECPAAYPIRQVFHAKGTDERACSACGCDAPTNVACTGASGSLLGNTCKATDTVTAPSACTPIVNGARVSTTPGSPSGGECAPKGGAPIGDYAAGETSTVCCLE